MAIRTLGTAMVLVVSACSTTTWAQDAVQAPAAIHAHADDRSGVPLPLDAAIAEALDRNPNLATLRAQLAVDRQRRAGEGFLEPPTVNAEIWQWPLTSINPLDTNMYMFTMRQEIPGRGKRAARAAAADRAVDVGVNAIAVRERDVIAQVTRSYAELVFTRQAIVMHEAHVDLLRQTADLVTARYGAGRGGQQEALKAVAEIARLHGDLVTLNERARIAASELNALLNREPETPIGTVTVSGTASALPPLAELQQLAAARHPELKGAALDTASAEAQVAVAASNYKPDFMVMGGYQLMPRTAGALTAGIGVTWPSAPWSRGALDAKRAEASAQVEVARSRQVEALNAIRVAVQQAYIHASAAAERARLFETTVVPQLQQVLDSTRIAYASERGDAASVIENERMVLDAQLAYYQSLSDASVARADLERAVGAQLPVVAARGVTP